MDPGPRRGGAEDAAVDEAEGEEYQGASIPPPTLPVLPVAGAGAEYPKGDGAAANDWLGARERSGPDDAKGADDPVGETDARGSDKDEDGG